jgi:hypothetical protein
MKDDPQAPPTVAMEGDPLQRARRRRNASKTPIAPAREPLWVRALEPDGIRRGVGGSSGTPGEPKPTGPPVSMANPRWVP